MKQINIYQAGLESGYTFMNYDYAKDLIEMEDYELVASFENDDNDDNDSVLNKLYNLGNDGTLAINFKMRSISVSDIIEIDGVKYYVDSFGFKKIESDEV